jgi:hypothetical protein
MLGAMMTTDQKPATRRGILAVLGLTGAAAASLTMLPRQTGETAEVAQTSPQKAPEKGGGYALTEHVKRYYQTTLI